MPVSVGKLAFVTAMGLGEDSKRTVRHPVSKYERRKRGCLYEYGL